MSHAISESNENDTIAVLSGQNLTEEENKWFALTILGKKLPIVITKSLNIICLSRKCKLSLPKDNFAFIAGHISIQINVSFVNFEITQERIGVETHKKCNPASHGFIVLKGCMLRLHNCVLKSICTAIYIFNLADDICGINITKASLEKVHYTIYSSNASLVRIEMRDTVVKGEHDATVPYHVISLISRGVVIIHIVKCIFHRVNEAVAVNSLALRSDVFLSTPRNILKNVLKISKIIYN